MDDIAKIVSAAFGLVAAVVVAIIKQSKNEN